MKQSSKIKKEKKISKRKTYYSSGYDIAGDDCYHQLVTVSHFCYLTIDSRFLKGPTCPLLSILYHYRFWHVPDLDKCSWLKLMNHFAVVHIQ